MKALRGRHSPSRRPVRRSRWPLLLACLPLAACFEKVPVGVEGGDELSCNGSGAIAQGGRSLPVAPNGFATVGNQIINATTCRPHRFVGVSRPGLAYAADDPRMAGSEAAASFATIRSWKANVVRIEVSQNFWVPGARYYDAAYAGRVDRAVKAARAAGLDVILALQTSDRGDPAYPGDIYKFNPQQEMPDVNHSVPFWKDLATRYKDDGRVIFEIFSEPFYAPHGKKSDWNLWLNGGTVPAGVVYEENRKSYQAVGMQKLYDTVRGTGANNLVIIGGTHWGYYLNEVPNYRVKGYNIVYASHPWDWSDKQPDTWDRDWASLAQTDPVMLSEIGNYNCKNTYLKQVLDKADKLQISWVAWAWLVPSSADLAGAPASEPTCNTYKLITDWSGTPSFAGKIVKERLASY